MARPRKEGVEYFPMDTNDNRMLMLIEAKFGPVGYYIITKITKTIYGEKGYYAPWDENSKRFLMLFQVSDEDIVDKVVDYAISIGYFDKEMAQKHEVLTSEEIQRTYFTITSKRKHSFDKLEYLIIDTDEYEKKEKVSEEKTPVNGELNTQIKEKENKEKENNKAKPKENYIENKTENKDKIKIYNKQCNAERKEKAEKIIPLVDNFCIDMVDNHRDRAMHLIDMGAEVSLFEYAVEICERARVYRCDYLLKVVENRLIEGITEGELARAIAYEPMSD